MNTSPRILVSRTDRLGDVLLALPSLEYLRRALPHGDIDFLCPPSLIPVVRPYLDSRHITPVPYTPDWSPTREYQAALLLFPEAALQWQCFRARIPVRVGNYSKLASFFLLNYGQRQSRSQAEKNEAEYNLDLARSLAGKLGSSAASAPPPVEIPRDPRAAEIAAAALKRLGVGSAFGVVHPGMGGSASNLSPASYLKVLTALEDSCAEPLVLSIGPSPADQEMARALLSARPALPVLRDLPLEALREAFRQAAWVVGPSTGPLHLAHYVGTRTTGLYPPILSQSPRRWRPYGGTGKSQVFSPEVVCPGARGCVGVSCPEFFCLDRLEWRGLLLRGEGGLKA